MSDYIKREDAIDVIEITPFEDYGDYIKAREIIENLPTIDVVPKDFHDKTCEAMAKRHTEEIQKYMWIPCSERLPSAKGEYLVTYHPCHWDFVESEIKVGIDMFRGKTTWAKNKYQRVIAWMPLPEPYKEGE